MTERTKRRQIRRLPLKDVRQLWYWGIWKEPTPSGFSTTVLVMCTSKENCRRYLRIQTHDFGLLDEEDAGGFDDAWRQTVERQSGRASDSDLFDETGVQDDAPCRRFQLVTYEQLLARVTAESSRHTEWGLTILINPYKETDAFRINFDAIYTVESFLAEQTG